MAMDLETLEVEYCEKLAHAVKMWTEGSRKPEPTWTSNRPLENYDFDYDGNLDRWDGFDAAACRRFLIMMEKGTVMMEKGTGEVCMIAPDENNSENTDSDDEDNANDVKVDEAKVDETKQQMDFAIVEKRRGGGGGGGSTGTVRNLRVRDDTADLKKANVAHKEASEDVIALTKEKQPATCGTFLDQVKLAEAVMKVTAEDMEAYRMKVSRVHNAVH